MLQSYANTNHNDDMCLLSVMRRLVAMFAFVNTKASKFGN